MPLIRQPPDPARRGAIDQATAKLNAQYQRLDAHLAQQAYLAGNDFTMGDVPLGAMTYRYLNLPIERPELPNLARWYRALTERPAYAARVMIEFGRNLEEWTALERAGAGQP
ncbi:MAG: glutathione S-transferase C-terminal domain-containing protein [Pseudomonadota bacterium]